MKSWNKLTTLRQIKWHKAQTHLQNLLGKFWYFRDFLFGNYNNCVSYSIFPNSLKNAIITPAHKNGAKMPRDNYKPESILSNTSKIYERLMFK